MTLTDATASLVNAVFAVIPEKKPSAERVHKACLIAHRGAHDKPGIIENTLAAFDRALSLGCFGIELDVQVTADNVLVVHHDATLQRLWTINQTIASMTFKSLRQQAPLIPSLEEVIAKFGKKIHLFIELKAPFAEGELLANTLQGLEPQKDYHLLSLDESVFENLKQLDRQAMLLVPQVCNVDKFCKLSLRENYGGVMGHYVLLTRAKTLALQNVQQKVGVGFIDSKYNLYRALNRDITWLFTNNSEVMISALSD